MILDAATRYAKAWANIYKQIDSFYHAELQTLSDDEKDEFKFGLLMGINELQNNYVSITDKIDNPNETVRNLIIRNSYSLYKVIDHDMEENETAKLFLDNLTNICVIKVEAKKIAFHSN